MEEVMISTPTCHCSCSCSFHSHSITTLLFTHNPLSPSPLLSPLSPLPSPQAFSTMQLNLVLVTLWRCCWPMVVTQKCQMMTILPLFTSLPNRFPLFSSSSSSSPPLLTFSLPPLLSPSQLPPPLPSSSSLPLPLLSQGLLDIGKQLLPHLSNINQRTCEHVVYGGYTPLHLAIQNRQVWLKIDISMLLYAYFFLK